MELKRELVDGVLAAITKKTPAIVRANIDLGIPIEDCICALVRKTVAEIRRRCEGKLP